MTFYPVVDAYRSCTMDRAIWPIPPVTRVEANILRGPSTFAHARLNFEFFFIVAWRWGGVQSRPNKTYDNETCKSACCIGFKHCSVGSVPRI